MLSADSLATIRSEGEHIIAQAHRDRERPVPQYPGWVMGDLMSHLGSVHARTALICREHPTERPAAPQTPEGADVLEWCAASLDEMVTALEASDPTTPVWGFWDKSSLGLWERRMLIETGIHRWDADQAFGEEGPLTDTVALSGLDEYASMWLSRLGEVPPIEVEATDLGRSWAYGSGAPEARVSGTASDVYLRLMSRASLVTLPETWATAVDALEGPKR